MNALKSDLCLWNDVMLVLAFTPCIKKHFHFSFFIIHYSVIHYSVIRAGFFLHCDWISFEWIITLLNPVFPPCFLDEAHLSSWIIIHSHSADRSPFTPNHNSHANIFE